MTPDALRTTGTPEDLPTPSAAFKARLKSQLMEAHAKQAARPAVSWGLVAGLTAPVAALALALVVFFRPASTEPFSPVRFLERAEAAVTGYEDNRIYYTRLRESQGKDAVLYDWTDPEPVTKETWSVFDHDKLYWMNRWTHDDGKVVNAGMEVTPGPDYIFTNTRYELPPEGGKMAVCIQAAEFVHDPDNPFAKPSEARDESDKQFDLLFALDSPKQAERIRALRKLVERGDAVYEGSYSSSGRTLRAFRVKWYNLTIESNSDETLKLDTESRFVRMAFDDDHAMRLREDWEVYDGKEHQTLVTEYLEDRIIDAPIAEVFDPKRFGLVNLWTYVPVPEDSLRDLADGESPCFYEGKRYESSIDLYDRVSFLDIMALHVRQHEKTGEQ